MSYSSGKDEVDTLVEVSWLASHLKDENVRVVESSWAVNDPRDFEKLHSEVRIPGSHFFHIDKIADTSVPLPHMLPSKELFEQTVGQMGISNNDHVVVYDRTGLYTSSARVWWTFRVFGHNRVSVLNGGFLRWQKEGHPTESGPHQPVQPAKFVATYHPELVEDLAAMQQHVKDKVQIVDARPTPRYLGKEPEPRPNLRMGHMPGAKGVPSVSVLYKANPEDTYHTFLPNEELQKLFGKVNVNTNNRVVTTCGSGVTASVVALALHLMGNRHYSVYDGSFAEWGQPKLEDVAPLVSGPEP